MVCPSLSRCADGQGNMSKVPPVHSVSYGDDEDSLEVDYMDRINVEFQKVCCV